MAVKLQVWNAALRVQGNRKLGDTGDERESARVLTGAWDDVVRECLEYADWNFATESVKLDADTGVEPEFGFKEVFAKPTDWMKTVQVSGDEYFNTPLVDYLDDINFLSADYSPIYMRYVSDDTGMGYELTRWPRSFTRYVEMELAFQTGDRLTEDEGKLERIEVRRDKIRRTAMNHDAMNEPQPKFPPRGGWSMSRGGRYGTRRDRGNRGSLTG